MGRDSKVQHNIECYKYLNSFSQREATSPSIDDRYVVGPCSINVMQVYISFLTEVLTFIVFVALEMCHVLGNAKSALSHLILATLPILPVKSKENLSSLPGTIVIKQQIQRSIHLISGFIPLPCSVLVFFYLIFSTHLQL